MSPKAFTEDEKGIVRSKLVEAALKFLSTTGIKKTTVEELARAAGISKGAFYMFYESKELLFLDALEEVQSKIHEEIISQIQKSSDKREGFISVVSNMYRHFTTNTWMLSLTNDEYEVLLRRVPHERIEAHIALDDASTKRMTDVIAGLNINSELTSAVMRMLFMCTLHRQEVGPLADDAFVFMLEAVADKLFSEDQK
jgi:AcrR family transcriptional regulator